MNGVWFRVTDPLGKVVLGELDRVIRVSYSWSRNGVGHMLLTVPPSAFPMFPIDARIEMWRSRYGVTFLDLDTVWFVRSWKFTSEEGPLQLQIGAYSANYLLSSRIVAYPAGSPQADKSGPIDNIMKAIVRENLITGSRTIANFVVEADTSEGPSGSKKFSYRNVLTVLQELSDMSRGLGTPVLFDVVYLMDRFEFRTFPYVRGRDRRLTGSSPLMIPSGTLADVVLGLDRSEEVTYVYGKGDGVESNAVVVAVSSDRLSETPYSHRECLKDAGNTLSTTDVSNAARERLWEGTPRWGFTATLRDTPATRYGVDWRWGDILSISPSPIGWPEQTFNCEVRRIHGLITEEQDKVEAYLDESPA